MHTQYLPDKQITDNIDQKLRALLSRSFVNNGDSDHFARQRFYKEMPQHRYLMWEGDDLVAHVAAHEKQATIDGEKVSIAGIAEVCVAHAFRGQGLVKRLLEQVHHDRLAAGDDFAVLFGKEHVYGSSGYRCVSNLRVEFPDSGWISPSDTMVRNLSREWPSTPVFLVGPTF